jgi:hypothetical protein
MDDKLHPLLHPGHLKQPNLLKCIRNITGSDWD